MNTNNYLLMKSIYLLLQGNHPELLINSYTILSFTNYDIY